MELGHCRLAASPEKLEIASHDDVERWKVEATAREGGPRPDDPVREPACLPLSSRRVSIRREQTTRLQNL
jgi:hypothetical protein